MEKEFNIRGEIIAVEEKILNVINLIATIIGVPLLLLFLYRINFTGVRVLYLIDIVAVLVVLLLYLLRKRVRFRIRAVIFILSLMALILPSIQVYGFYGWGYIAIFYSFLAALFFGKRWGLLSILYSAIFIFFSAYYFVSTHTTFGGTDIRESNHFYELIFHGIMLISISLIVVFSINRYRDYFYMTIANLFQAKSSAEELEQKYKQLSGLTFEGIMIHDNGVIIDVNQSFANMLGYSADELIGKNMLKSNVIPVKYHKAISENMQKDYAVPYELEGIKKDGSIYPIEVESRNFDTGGGKVLRVTAIRDISYRKKLEDELTNSQRRFSRLFENSSDALFIIEGFEFVKCNNAAVKLFGYNSKDDLYKVSPADLSPEMQPDGQKSLDKASEMIELVLKNGTNTFEWMHQKRDGEPFFAEVSLTAIPNESGDFTIHTVIRDISERVMGVKKLVDKNSQLIAVEEKLRSANEKLLATTEALQANNDELVIARKKTEESEQLYRGIVDNLIGGYYRADAEGKLIIASPSAEEIVGFSQEEFLGRSVTSFYANPAERDVFVEKIKKEGKVYKYSTEFKTKNRGIITIETNAKVIFNDKGEYSGVEGVFYDVTEKSNWEKELVAAKEKAEESDMLKTMFLQNMSHEIRTPLNAILGFSSFIDDPELPVDERSKYSDIIQKSGNQLLQIVDEIMEMSMLESKNVYLDNEKVRVNELLWDLFSMFETKAKEKSLMLNLKNCSKDDKRIILTDKAKLTKVLRNLLENAIKYTNEGFVEYGYNIKGKEMTFYVKDSGIGILPENIERVFDRFTQESEELSSITGGLGLGLSITKENVKLLGGEITLKSEFGKGSVFYVTIPYEN